jgi:hypothetical protein
VPRSFAAGFEGWQTYKKYLVKGAFSFGSFLWASKEKEHNVISSEE